MAKTGPQHYPGASDKYRYDGRYPGSPMETNVLGWHCTEGPSVPGYRGGADAPNFTVAPDFKNRRGVWYQHHDFDSSSRAAMNLAGGVETNTANLCQIEIVGTCDPKHKTSWTISGRKYVAGIDYLFTPELPGWFIEELAEFSAWAFKNHGVKLQSIRPNGQPLNWKPYPASYGTRAQNGVRLTNAEWNDFYGHCAHQHFPENLHGDTGNMDIEAILTRARELVDAGTPPKPPATPPVVVKPKYEPFPGASFFKNGRKSPIIKAMRSRLIAEGCNRYQSTSNPDTWGSGDEASYAAWQRKRGFNGDDANGTPGKLTWDALKVPNV